MKKLMVCAVAVAFVPAITMIPAAARNAHVNHYAQARPPQPSVDVSQLDMNAVPDLDRSGVRRVQELLRERGFDPGPLDGIYGPLTTNAVRTYQDRYGIRPRGEVDNQTLFALGAIDLAGAQGGGSGGNY